MAGGLAERWVLLDLLVENAMPALVGGWRGGRFSAPKHLEPPRPTDIAGKTRWWLRAVIGGLAYALAGRFPTLSGADRAASRLMGWSPRGGGGGEASRYIIQVLPVEPLEKPYLEPWHGLSRHVFDYYPEPWPPRVVLQTLGKGGCDRLAQLPLPPGAYRFRVRLLRRPGAAAEPWMDDLASASLLAALFLTGIGRAVTRGFGKLRLLEAMKQLDPDRQPLAAELLEAAAHGDPKELAEALLKVPEALQDYEGAKKLANDAIANKSKSTVFFYPVNVYPVIAHGYMLYKRQLLSADDPISAAYCLVYAASQASVTYIDRCCAELSPAEKKCRQNLRAVLGARDNREAKQRAIPFLGGPRRTTFSQHIPNMRRLQSPIRIAVLPISGVLNILVYGFKMIYNASHILELNFMPTDIREIIDVYSRCICEIYFNCKYTGGLS